MLIKRISDREYIHLPMELVYERSSRYEVKDLIKRLGGNNYLSKYVGRRYLGSVVVRCGMYNVINIRCQKFQANLEINNKKIKLFCWNCRSELVINNHVISSKKYHKCLRCHKVNNLQTKELMKYYLIYDISLYYEIIIYKNKKRSISKAKMIEKQIEKQNYIDELKASNITVMVDSNNSSIIVPRVFVEIMDNKDLTEEEKKVLCKFKMPVKTYKILKERGVNFIDI